MKRWVVLCALTAMVVLGAVACSSCGKDEAAAPSVAFLTGAASFDELAQDYVAAIVGKDPEQLRKTLLSADDLALLQKGKGKQYWQAYFMLSKQAFLEKNRALLGQDLTVAKAVLGRQIAQREGVTVYRGSEIRMTTPKGKGYVTEISFVVEAGGMWKIFGVKYMADGMPKRGVLEGIGLPEDTAKFKGINDARDVNIKIKKKPNPIPEDQLPSNSDPATPGG